MTVTGINENIVDGTNHLNHHHQPLMTPTQTTTLTLSLDQTVSAATTTDDDIAGFTIVQTGGSTGVAETGTTDTFTVVLTAQPTSRRCSLDLFW
ncbi:MAG: hypothetical protein ACJZ2F_02075 [Acidimicrobiales bacterium]